MKNLLFAVVASFTLCSYSPFETIVGNGNMKKESRNVGKATGVALSGNLNVQIAYGTSETISVEADENLLPYILTSIEDGILTVKTKNKTGLKSKSRLIVYVSLTKLTELKVSGSGNMNGSGDFSNDNKTNISISGSGNINLHMDSFNETNIAISGSGNVILKGNNTNNIDATLSGSGNIDCTEISCNDVFAQVSGSGNIRVFANRRVNAKVSGSGNIYYKGAAKDINLKSSGSGKIIKV